MGKIFQYKTVLLKNQGGVYAEFPFDSFSEFGTRKPVRVKVSFDGHQYSMSLLPRGNGQHWMHVKKEIRVVLEKDDGDMIEVKVEQDFEIPGIIIPEYLQWLLDNDPEMKKSFQKMPISAKKFWLESIEETNNPDTKVERINRMFDFLRGRF